MRKQEEFFSLIYLERFQQNHEDDIREATPHRRKVALEASRIMVRFPPLLSPLFLLLHLLLFATSSEAGLFRGSARPTPLQQLKTRVQSEDKKALTFLRGDFELSCWLRVTGGDVDEACRRVLEKAEWRKGVGKVTMADCARGFGSDGYALQLGGLFDRRGCPLVYSHGLPRGSEAQIRSMTVYMQERVLDACAQNSGGGRRGRGGGGGGGGGGYEGGGGRRPYCAPLTIIDCTQPSFRSPDGALRRGGIDVVSRYYPWSREGTTLFLGVRTRSFKPMNEHEASSCDAKQFVRLSWVPISNSSDGLSCLLFRQCDE